MSFWAAWRSAPPVRARDAARQTGSWWAGLLPRERLCRRVAWSFVASSRIQVTLQSSPPSQPPTSRLTRSARRRPRARRARRARPARAAPRLAEPPSPSRGRHPGSLPAPRRSRLWSFLDTLAYPAFIDTLWRLPRSPDQAMYYAWQRARVIHDVATIQQIVVASDDYVELVLQPQDAEHAPGLFAVGLGGEGRRETFLSDAPEQGYVVRVAVLLDQIRVAQHLLVDAEPDLDVGLPRRAHAKLRHARPGRVLELEPPHQVDGDLLARETHQVSKGS